MTTIRLQPVVAVLALVGLFAISVLIGYVGGLAFLAPSAPMPARSVRPAPVITDPLPAAQTPAPTSPAPAKRPGSTAAPPAPVVPATPPASPPPQAAEPGVLYRVQVGAYISKENAETRAAKLRDAGFDAYVTQAGSLFKVQVGAFAVRENAARLAEQLRAAGYDALITP